MIMKRSHRRYSIPLIATATYLQCGVDAFPLTHRQAVKSTLMGHQLFHHIRQSTPSSYRRRYKTIAAENSSSSDSFQEARLTEQLRQNSSNSGGHVNICEDEEDSDDIPLTSIDDEPTTTAEMENNDDTSINKKRDIFKQILSLFCHPMNFLIVTIFHILGVCQATTLLLSKLPPTLSNNNNPLLLSLLMQPSMCIVLLSLLLITSMIKNCNYDSCYYNETTDNEVVVNDTTNNEPPFSINKRTFDTYLYAILLLLSSSISGSLPRIMVSGGAIITYLYTTHLQTKFEKRKWITNLGSAVLLTLSPLTSGLAACHVLSDASFLSKRGIFIGGASLDTDGLVSTLHSLPFDLVFKSPLSFMMIALFGVLMSRELVMDMITNEIGAVKEGQIEDVASPGVQQRKQMASVILGCTILTALAACASSIVPFYNILMALITDSESRKAVLSVWGSTMLTWRAWRLWNNTKGEKKSVNLAERAVREGLIYAVMILASFL